MHILLFLRYWCLNLENSFFPTTPLFDALTQGEPIRILDEAYPSKTKGMGLLYGVNCIILTSTVFDWSTHVTDSHTDGRIIAYSTLSIYAVTC